MLQAPAWNEARKLQEDLTVIITQHMPKLQQGLMPQQKQT